MLSLKDIIKLCEKLCSLLKNTSVICHKSDRFIAIEFTGAHLDLATHTFKKYTTYTHTRICKYVDINVYVMYVFMS